MMISKKKEIIKISLNEIALDRVKFGAFSHLTECEGGYSNIASSERTSTVAHDRNLNRNSNQEPKSSLQDPLQGVN